ncbi:MAG: mechanosensitive ion channel [Caldilineales bacterium]
MQGLQDIDPNLLALIVRLGAVVGVLIAGRWLARRTRQWLIRPLQSVPMSETMVNLTTTLAYYALLVLTVALALAALGVPGSAILAVILLFLLVLAIALQQSLASLAATINFYLFKPFEVGHLIDTAGVMGVVREVQLFNSVLLANDLTIHVLPNAKIQSNGLTNYSKMGATRLKILFRISYDSDADAAVTVLTGMLARDARVLTDPPPLVYVQELSESAIHIAVCPYVGPADYFQIQRDLPGRVKTLFEEAGIRIPFPQQEVTIRSRPGAAPEAPLAESASPAERAGEDNYPV